MVFDYKIESIRTDALNLDYFLVPWDTAIFEVPIAQIESLRVIDRERAADDYEQFVDWCRKQNVAFCACRLPADRLADSMFLESRGFRFVELNYLPVLTGIQALRTGDDGIVVAAAGEQDREPLRDMATQVFKRGRFHQDPRIAAGLGDRRYRAWIDNAFENDRQRVLKCSLDGQMIAFFVVEAREPGHCFWSLNGLAPGYEGIGLGKRVWRSMLYFHRSEGAHTVSTSISSHNVRAFNLYASLNFRFPSPSMTFQWCPTGTLVGKPQT